MKKILIATTVLSTLLAFHAEARLYKWVDSNGTTHYGETIPPEYANREPVKLEKGRIEKREDKRANAENKPLKDPQAEKARREAERRDNALLSTYASEQEIDLALARNLQQVDARTNSYRSLLKSAQDNLAQLEKEREDWLKQGRQIPKSLEEDLVDGQSRVEKFQRDLEGSLKEAENVRARFEADKQRYRELKGLPATVK
ncbi:MAG: hypothetical protein Fur0040_05970 [Sideroxydans sp.]